MFAWKRSKPKKQTPDELSERHTEDAMMEAESPVTRSMPGSVHVSQPPDTLLEAGKLNPVQELRKCAHNLKEVSDTALQNISSVCEENEKKTKAIEELLEENSVLRELVEKEKQEKNKFAEELKVRQEEIMQLRQNQESAKAHFTAVVSERDKLKSEVGHHEAREAELCSQLEEKEKQIFHHQQAYFAQHQKLRDVAAIAIANTSVGQVQGEGEQARYSLPSCRRRKTHMSESSGVVTMDESCVNDGTVSHPQSPPASTFQLPASGFLPDVSTNILANYIERMAPHWYEIAHALGVGNVAKARKQTEEDPERKCLLCLEAWIERGDQVECSWDRLLRVLCNFHLHSVAKDIHDELLKITKFIQSI